MERPSPKAVPVVVGRVNVIIRFASNKTKSRDQTSHPSSFLLQGVWKPKRIPNPSYFEDDHPFDSLLTISAIGFELWTMSGSIHFDNIIICSELTVANNFASEG